MVRLIALFLLSVSGVLALDAEVLALQNVSVRELPKVLVLLADQQKKMDACEDLKIKDMTSLTVVEPVGFSTDSKTVVKGKWVVRYAVDACGEKGLRTVEFNFGEKGLEMQPLVPGDSLADGRLQGDVLKSFGISVRVMMPRCDRGLLVRDAKVLYVPSQKDVPWKEVWIARACGRDVGQVVEFMPTKTGTAFKMSVPKVADK